MSEPPGNNSRPRTPRGGRNRSHGKGNREPRREQEPRDNRRDDRQENRRPKPRNDRRRDRDRGDRRGPRPEHRPSPQAAKPTVWQKLLTILTFGLVRPKSAKKPGSGQQSRPKQNPPSPPRASRPSSAVPPPADPETVDTERLHVGNLSYDATESDLLDLFKGVGKVESVDIVYNGRTHRSKGFGFVQMMSVTDARRAVAELHGKSFMGRLLQLGPARGRGRDEREADDDQET